MIKLMIATESFKTLQKYYSGEINILTRNREWTHVQIEVSNQTHILQILAAGKQLGRMESAGVITSHPPELAAEAVCWAYGLEPQELKGKRRNQHIVDGRHAWRYILNKMWGLSTVKAGAITSSDHTTIINSIDAVNSLQLTDENFAQKLKNAVNYIHIKTKKNEQLHNQQQPVNVS
jgi:hypothetical protein